MKNTSKILALVLVLMMAFAVLSAFSFTSSAAGETKTIYFKVPTSGPWHQGNERYAVYSWGGTTGNTWNDLKDADGDGVYSAEIPAGDTMVIFCRMNKGKTANNWNNKWNQSADYPLGSTDLNTVYFTVANQNSQSCKVSTSPYTPPVVTHICTPEVVEAESVPATCLTEGLQVTKCSDPDCGKKEETILSAGHTFVNNVCSACGFNTKEAHTVYFKNTSNWTKVQAYYWGEGNPVNWPGTAMTKENDLYVITIPAGSYNVIFNNKTGDNGDQTSDIVIPAEPMVYNLATQKWEELPHICNFVAGEVVAPTYTTEGYTVYTCSCGKTENRDVVPALAAVAQIGDVKYSTLAEALEAAKSLIGDVVVEIYDKVTLNTSLSGSYDSITFVGKDTDAEIYLEVQGYITATDKTVSFEDLTLSKSAGGFITNAGFMNVAFGVYDVNAVNYTNCIFANGAYASSGDVTFTDCTFYRSHDKYGLWAYGNANIVVQDSKFDDYRGIKMYAEDAAKTTDLTVKNTDFSALDSKPAIVLTYGESVTLEGNTYSDTGVFELDLDGAPNGVAVTSDVAPTCKNDNGACGVLVDGKIYTTVAQAAAVATSGSTVTLLHDSTETVELAEGVTLDKNGYTADNVTVAEVIVYVAQVGDVKYSTLAEALAAAKDGETIVLTANINYGSDQLKIEKAIILDLGGYTLTTANNWGGMSVKGNPTIKNGTIVHTGNTAAIKVWNATAFENLTIEVSTYTEGKTKGGIVLQSGSTTRVDSIKNVTIKGAGLTNGIETYNCGDAAQDVIGALENVTINANGTGMLISAPVGTATNCTINGGVNGIEIWIKGNYSASLELVDCDVKGGVFAHDEFTSNPGAVNNGKLEFTADDATTGADAKDVTLTINQAENVAGLLKEIKDNAQAQVNGTYYATFAEAMAAAKAGDVIKVVAGTYAVPSMKAGITIEGVGEVLFEGTLSGTLENLTLKNIHIKGDNAQRWAYAKGDLVFENVTFEATSVYALHFDGITEGATLLYKDCTIIGWAAMSGSPASCVFDGCTIKGNGSYGVIRTYFDATIENCTFDVSNVNPDDVYQDGIHSVGATVTVNNCTNANGEMNDIINISTAGYVVLDGETIHVHSYTAGETVAPTYNADGYTVYTCPCGNVEHRDIVPALVAVAKIGETNYATLADAIAAAVDGDTIVLVADIDLGTNSVTVKGKELTLDLNGHNITGSGYRVLVVDLLRVDGSDKRGVLTLTGNGTVKNTGTTTGNSYAVYVGGSSDLIVKTGVTLNSDYGFTVLMAPMGAGRTSTLTLDGGSITGRYGVSGNGTLTDTSTSVTINSGSIDCTEVGIYQPQPGTVTINGGTVSGAEAALALRRGEATITDGAIVGLVDVIGDYEASSLAINGGDLSAATLQYADGNTVTKAEGVVLAAPEGFAWINDVLVAHAEHSYEKVVTAPTCTEAGYTTYTCECGDTYTDDEVASLGHDIIVDEAVAPTCTETGLTAGEHCSRCDHKVAQEVVPAKGHNYVNGTCTVCKTNILYFINTEKWTKVNAYMWDVANNGWPGAAMTKTGEKINGYDVYKVEYTAAYVNVIFNNGSSQTADLVIAKGQYFCPLNSIWYKSASEVPSFEGITKTNYFLPGDFNSWKDANAFLKEGESTVIRSYVALAANKTYTFKVKTGNTWYGSTGTVTAANATIQFSTTSTNAKITTACAGLYIFEYDTSTKKLTVIYPCAEEVVPGKAATCTETGLTEGKKCSVCGTVIVAQKVVPVLEHNFGEWSETTAPTCTEKGVDTRACADCGATETRDVDAKGHTEEVVAGKDATCTETGLTEGKKCKVCGTVTVAQEEIPANGHSFGEWAETTAPTCTEKGVDTRACANCDATETRDVDAKGHNEEVVAGKDATCTETGLTEGKKCTVCGTVTVAQEEIPAKGHTEEVVAGKAATCTEAGLTEGKKCSVCGEVLAAQEEIPATGHNYVDGKCECGAEEPAVDEEPELNIFQKIIAWFKALIEKLLALFKRD